MKTIAQQLNIKEFPFVINDSKGNALYVEDSKGIWIKSEYDSKGIWIKSEYDSKGRTYYEDSYGDWWKVEFDSKGNEIYYEDSDGNIEDRRPKKNNN